MWEDDLYGLVVDQLRNVVPVNVEQIEPPPGVISSAEAEFLSGIARPPDEGMIILVDLGDVVRFDVSTSGARAGARGRGTP